MLSDLIKGENRLRIGHRLRPSVPTILVDRDPKGDLLIGHRGHPVWPIRDEADWRAVSRLCQLRSIRIHEVQGRPGETKQRKDVVTGLGCQRIQEIGRLYAHLTARRFEGATSESEVRDLSRSAVVVTTFERLTANMLHALYSDVGAPSATGLICASGVEELRPQVLVRSILARTRLSEETAPWTIIFPTANVGTHAEAPYQVLGENSSHQAVRQALKARSGLLAISTHSDGVDAMLRRSLTLCAIASGHAGVDMGRAPSCQISGYCHRHGVSVSKFLRLEAAIAPTEFSAGVLLLDTCFGTLPSDAPIDSKWGLGRHFIENLEIGAIATTWELALLDVRKLERLIIDLRSGMTLGRAVARFNNSAMARRTATRLAVFGEPKTRAASRRRVAPSASRKNLEANSRPYATPSAELRELGFSRAYLQYGVAALSRQLAASSPRWVDQIKRQLEGAQNALERLTRYELSQWLEPRSVSPEDAEELRRALIMDAYVRRPTDDWIEFANATDWTGRECTACGAPAKLGVLTLRIPGVSRRRVVMCPRCGITEDMPEHVQIGLRFDPAKQACGIAGALPDRDWSAALIVRTRIEANDRIWVWPAQTDGKPCGFMQLPEAMPHGPLKLAVILVHRGWLAWTAQDIYGTAPENPAGGQFPTRLSRETRWPSP